MRTCIRCSCGNRVAAKDVMQKGYYLRVAGPSFIWLKFRCSRCKKSGEQFIKQEEWDEKLLQELPTELDEQERVRLSGLGPITIHEVIDVHFQLEHAEGIPDLLNVGEKN